MAGAPTKFGFAGGEAPTGKSHPRSLPTLLGHDPHHPDQPGPGETLPTPPPVQAAAAPPEEQEQPEAQQDPTLRPPTHTGKSNYPTVARLFGQWNQDGQLVPSEPKPPAATRETADTSSASEGSVDEDSLIIPRQGVPRWVLLAIGAAVVFAVVAFLVAGRERPRPPATPPASSSSVLEPRRAPAALLPEAAPPTPARPRRAAVLATTRGGATRGRGDAPRRRPPPRPSALSDDALPPSF
jgi:hypothetical protein